MAMLGCRQDARRQAPPDAQRPVIKTEAELAAQREERIRAGQVVPTSSPVLLGAERIATPQHRPPPPIQPPDGAIEADIIMVNKSVLTVAELLYPVRDEIEEIRRVQTPGGFRERVDLLLRQEARRQIGSLLVYAEATANFTDPQREAIKKSVDKEIDTLTARDFGGSSARLKSRLSACGLSMDQFREGFQRELVVRQYTREKLMPQIQIRRDELLGYYRHNISRYQSAETRELLMIELPFEKFLPDKQPWAEAGKPAQAAAKLAALRRAREAHAALAERPFEDVAREYGLGVHTEQGGSWGMIGRPLQPPYDGVSRLIFEYQEGQYSEPVETASSWCIVRCGRVEPATERPFLEVQDDIRKELMERRFNKLAMDYVLRLAENATISSLDLFVTSAVKRAERMPASMTGGQ